MNILRKKIVLSLLSNGMVTLLIVCGLAAIIGTGTSSPPSTDETSNTVLDDGPCNPNPCLAPNKRNCVVESSMAVCECSDGFVENDVTGECIDACDDVDCGANGNCVVSERVVGCDCDAGFVDSNLTCVDAATVPIVSITAEPVSGSVPLTVAFQATVTGGDAPLTFFWVFGDGDVVGSTEKSPVHTYAQAGLYPASVLVTDRDGDKGSAAVGIDVSEAGNATLVDVAGNDRLGD